MAKATLKPEFKDKVIGFKNKSGKLGDRSEKDLQAFYESAKKRDYQDHLDMFDVDETAAPIVSDAEKAKNFNDKQAVKNTGKVDA